MRSEDIKNRQWTEKERQALRRAGAKQAAGDELRMNLGEVPALTEEQLEKMVRARLDPRVLEQLKSKGEGQL